MTRCRLLLVDSSRTVAIASLPPIQSRAWKSINSANSFPGGGQAETVGDSGLNLGHLEGKTCTCHGFTVFTRVTRDQ